MSVALVLGGGQGVWDDVAAALDLGEFSGVVACNDAGAAYPGPLDAVVSLHPEKWGYWMEQRRRRGYPMPAQILGHSAARDARRLPPCVTGFVDQMFPGQKDTGSSGLLALKTALVDRGFDKAVLCGVPMDPRPHFFDGRAWTAVQSHWRGWLQALPQIEHRARSMSGRTRELLGAPTEQWLSSE